MLTRSMEDYLEAVLILGRTGGRVRIVDVARFLGVRMPSVTGMVKTLVSNGYMEHSRYGDVRLTEKGRKVAEQVLRRHNALKSFLVEVLGVGSDEAEATACAMEHVLGQDLSERFATFVEFVKTCPRCGRRFLQDFLRYARERKVDIERCRKCINDLRLQR